MGADPNQIAMLVDREEEESDDEEVLVEEREAEMVSLQNPDAPVRRKGWFLKSSFSNGNVGNSSTLVPSSFKSPNSPITDEPKVQFKGWSSSPRQWEQWVAKLLPKYGVIWKKVQIFDAILSSTCRIRRDPSSLFGLVSHWSEETNTFLFPWGEVTVTLEDIIILTGFSVLGEPVRAPLPAELRDIENKLNEERLKFNRSTSKKAHHSAWVKEFIDRDDDELEHAAFLSLWLSRFVLCSHPESTIRQNVFPIAARLSKGQRIALAPSILASIYRDLREIKRCLNQGIGLSSTSNKEGSLIVWSPLQILQIWIWERFPGLRPDTLNPTKEGQPRAAKWHDVGKKLHPVLVQSILNSHNNFLFRPYAISSSDWYKEGCDELIRDDELRSFAQCLCRCELVGADCIEQYLPNRVAMQFGFDQDVPDPFKRVDQNGWEDAWQSYEITADNMSLYVPPQPFEPGLTVNYMAWWREKMVPCCSVGTGSTGGTSTGTGTSEIMLSENKGKNKSRSKKMLGSPDKRRKVKEFYFYDPSKTGESIGEDNGSGSAPLTREIEVVTVEEPTILTGEESAKEGAVLEKKGSAITGEEDKGKKVTLESQEIIVTNPHIKKSEKSEEREVPVVVENLEIEREPEVVAIAVPPREEEMLIAEFTDRSGSDLNLHEKPIMDPQPVKPGPIPAEGKEITASTEVFSASKMAPPVSTEEETEKKTETEKQPLEESISRERRSAPDSSAVNEEREEESESSREKRRMNRERYERYAAEMKAKRQKEEARAQREIAILRRDVEVLREEVMDLERFAGIR